MAEWDYYPSIRWQNKARHKPREIVPAIKLIIATKKYTFFKLQKNKIIITWVLSVKNLNEKFKIYMCINWNICFVLLNAHT